MRVLHVVPRLPPPPDGVGDYARAIAGALAEHRGITSSFAVPETAATEASEAGAAVLPRQADGASAVLARRVEETGASAIVVHYVNYGYRDDGCPEWLVGALETLGAPSLVTVFHEVHASGPPWRRAFWSRRRQRRLAGRLAARSAAAVTSLALYRDLVRRLAPDLPIEVLPVPSPVGEPRAVPALADRPPRLVVFGGAGNRRRLYRRGAPELDRACVALGVERVVDVGPAGAEPPERLCGRPVEQRGELPAEQVAAELLAARAGALAYPGRFLPKSTVFAAYCATGVVPLCPAGGAEGEGLRAGEHYWTPGLPTSGAALGAIAARARAWYAGHSLERQAARFARLLAGGER